MRHGANHFKYFPDGRFLIIGQVHGNLHDVALGQIDAQRLAILESAALLTDGARDLLRNGKIVGVQVDVICDQREARADGDNAAGGMRCGMFLIAVIGNPLRILHLFCHAFEFALAAGGEISSLFLGRGIFIQIAGHADFLPDALGDDLGNLDAFLGGHAAAGDEGDYVGSTHAGMLSLVMVHVDQLDSLLGHLNGGFLHRLGSAYQRKYAAVVITVGLNIEYQTARDGFGNCHQRVKGIGILFAAAAEIRYAFD